MSKFVTLVFYILIIKISQPVQVQGVEEHLSLLRGENVVSLKMMIDIDVASELCHNLLGGKFPSIFNNEDINDLAENGVNNFFLDVKKSDNSMNNPNSHGTYESSNHSILDFHPWHESYPKCTDNCCLVLYYEKGIYDFPCTRTLANMVCVLPNINSIDNKEQKELVQLILDSSDEEDAKKIINLSYREFKNLKFHLKLWMEEEVYFNQDEYVTKYQAMSRCSAMGGQLPSVHYQSQMDSLGALVGYCTIFLGSINQRHTKDTLKLGDWYFKRTLLYGWMDRSEFEYLNWSDDPSCVSVCCSVLLYTQLNSFSKDVVLADGPCSASLQYVCVLNKNKFSLNSLKNERKIDKNFMQLNQSNWNLYHRIKLCEKKLYAIEIILMIVSSAIIVLIAICGFLYYKRSYQAPNIVPKLGVFFRSNIPVNNPTAAM